MKIIIAITFLLALAECRRHLCDDGTRPYCPGGAKAVYNRPTGKNTNGTSYFPPPVCSGLGNKAAVCRDGSIAKPRFNKCKPNELKCPKGHGWGPNDRPFQPCADGSRCECPGPGTGCQFRYKRCANGWECRKRCTSGKPHCPWVTKNRNPHNGTRIHNTGPLRPGNKEGGHNWGGDFPGNRPYPRLVKYGPFGRLNGTRDAFTDRFASKNGKLPITEVEVFQGSFRGHENVIVGIQISYDGTPADLHGRSTDSSVSVGLGADLIRRITVFSFEEGLPRPNKFVNGLMFETSDGRKIRAGSQRGSEEVIPYVRVDPPVIPRQNNDIPGGYSLAFISGYTVIDTPTPVLGQINFFFNYFE